MADEEQEKEQMHPPGQGKTGKNKEIRTGWGGRKARERADASAGTGEKKEIRAGWGGQKVGERADASAGTGEKRKSGQGGADEK